eukprot:scaffold227606_cov26-Tisochrysis_lutea.AAC.1
MPAALLQADQCINKANPVQHVPETLLQTNHCMGRANRGQDLLWYQQKLSRKQSTVWTGQTEGNACFATSKPCSIVLAQHHPQPASLAGESEAAPHPFYVCRHTLADWLLVKQP